MANIRLHNPKMFQNTQKSKQVILVRAGLVLSFFMLLLGAVIAFFSGVSAFVVLGLGACAALLLWAAMFASQKAALVLGRFFPLETLEQKKEEVHVHTSVSSIEIDALAQKIWDTLTKPELVRLWDSAEISTTWEPGSRIYFRSEWNEEVYEQWGKVIEFIPPLFLKYSLTRVFDHRPDLDVLDNYFYLSYALNESNGKTTLTITEEDSRRRTGRDSTGDEQKNRVLKVIKELAERK